MRILFDMGHPAHFHLFRHALEALREGGHDVEIFARQKDCLPDLLDAAGWAYRIPPRGSHGLAAKGWEAARVLREVLGMSRPRPFDIMAGTSVVIGPAARMTGATSVVFSEDDAAVVRLFSIPAYAAAHYVVTPRCLAHERHGSKHLTYAGYQELAYLHPKRFRADEGVRGLLGVKPGERYFLVRLVALRAHHDAGQKGLSAEQARQVVRRLAQAGVVFVSREAGLTADVGARALPTPPDRIFDVLAGADLLVCDSQTMAAEAAVLGTPSLRCNTFVGRISYLEELEHRYGLTEGVRPERFAELTARIDEWLSTPDLRDRWQRKRRAMLSDCIDLTDWIVDLFGRLARRGAAREAGAPEPPR